MAHAALPERNGSSCAFNVATLRAVNKATITLNKPQVSLGRARECDVCIAESFLSRRHANFTWVNNVWYIESLGTNGVCVNFKTIPVHKPVCLSDKDNIEFVQGSGLKYIFRTSASVHSGPTAAKRPRIANEPPSIGEEHSSNSQQLEAALLRQEELLHHNRKVVAENEALKAENNVLKEKIAELQLKLEQEARPREQPLVERENEPAPAVSLQQVEGILEQDLSCSICCELFVSAVTLSCRHTFCMLCLQQWSSTSEFFACRCPVCRALPRFQVETPVFDSVIDSLVQCLGTEAQRQRRNLIAQRSLARDRGTGAAISGNNERTSAQQNRDSTRALGAVPRVRLSRSPGIARGQTGHRSSPRRPSPGNRRTPAGRRQAGAPVISVVGSQPARNVQDAQ